MEKISSNRLLIEEIKSKFLTAIWVRYTLVAVGFGIIYVSLISGAYLPLSFSLLALVTAYNLVAHLISLLKKRFGLWQIIALGFLFELLDIAAITFIIYITGWVESPYWFLYLVLIVISGFGMFSYYSFSVFLIAFFSALFYLGLLWAAYLGVLPVYGPGLSLTPQQMLQSISNKAVFTTVSFILFALSIYYFSKLLNQQREELSYKNLELLSALFELKDIDRLKDDFVSTASHELRTPLSVIRENMSLIEDGIIGGINEQQKKLLQTSRVNVDRLAQILNNLLDLSKIESRSLELNRQTIDVRREAVKAIDFFKNRAAQKGITIEQNMPQICTAWVDADQIYRVFVNLLFNAIKFTGPGGRITVGAENTDHFVRCFVADTGSGIAPDDLHRVFDRFTHIGSESERGSGLGLSICKGIIEMHGGKIWAESTVGKGTKFIFSLPKVK